MWAWIFRLVPLLKTGSPVLVALACGAFVSWYLTNDHYQKEIKATELKMAIERAEQGKKEYAKIVAVTNKYDIAKRDLISSRADLERLRNAYHRTRAQASTPSVDAEAIGRCEELLREGAELLSEGRELLQSNALAHDALVETVE